MNKNPLTAEEREILRGFFKDKQGVRDLFRRFIEEHLDDVSHVRNLDVDSNAADIGTHALSRKICYDALIDIFAEIGLASPEEVKVKGKRFPSQKFT